MRKHCGANELDIIGAQFGIKIIPREKGQGDLIEVYTEDDETFFHTDTFAAFWLKDLITVLTEASQKADTEIIFKR